MCKTLMVNNPPERGSTILLVVKITPTRPCKLKAPAEIHRGGKKMTLVVSEKER